MSNGAQGAPGRDARRAALNQATYDALVPTVGVLSLLYLAYAVAHALTLPADLRPPLMGATLATAAALASVAVLMRRGVVPVTAAPLCGAVVAVLVLANCVLHLALSGEPRQTTNLVLAFLGAGMVFLSWRLLAMVLAVGWAAFATIASLAPSGSSEWLHFGVALATASALTVIVHAARVRFHLRFHALHETAEQRNRALEEAVRSLEESEQRHRHLVENDLGIILTHDLEGGILSINPAAASALGRDRASLLGTRLCDVLSPAFVPRFADYLERAARLGRDTGVMHVRTADGEERLWEYLCARPEDRGRAPYLVLHAHDITERVRLEDRLRAAHAEVASRVRERTRELEEANAALREEIDARRRIAERLLRYARAVESCSDAIVLAEEDGTIVDANATFLALCGAGDRAAVLGRHLLDFAAPDDRTRAGDALASAASGVDRPPEELELLRVDGERVPMEAAMALVRDETGSPRGVVAVGRDVTWRRAMEASLRHSEAFLRTLIEHSTDTIFVLDVDGTIIARPDRGSSAIGRYGHASEAVLGRLGQDFLHPQDAAAVAATFSRIAAAAGSTAAVECRLRDGAGRWRPSEVVLCNLLEDPAVGGVMCTVRDLTARKEAEAALREARDVAEAASQAKTEFLNTMSHELRTPIHAILGYAEMLEQGAFGALTAEQGDAVQRIAERARDQFELVSAVLDLNAMESGRVIVRTEPVRIADVVAQVEREGRRMWSESAVELAWMVPATLPAIASDAAKIRIVVRNLVANAVKFTPRGRVTVGARRVRAGIEIAVADTGIGIPEELRDAIFEPFFQIDGSESRRYEGSGLGLHIVKRLLALLGGTITLESRVGEGSTFRAWLPLFPPARDAAFASPKLDRPSRSGDVATG